MDFENDIKIMVSEQLIARGITSPAILNAFSNVPRHFFVKDEDIAVAYADRPIGLSYGQTISQPYIVARMLELLELQSSDTVLEIGTGSGYQTAILSHLCSTVYTVERIAELLEYAKGKLNALGLQNIHYALADGSLGWEEHSPFDKIIVSASTPSIPQALTDQLANNGAFIAPVGSEFVQTLTLLKKINTKTLIKTFDSCIFVKLVGQQGWKNNE